MLSQKQVCPTSAPATRHDLWIPGEALGDGWLSLPSTSLGALGVRMVEDLLQQGQHTDAFYRDLDSFGMHHYKDSGTPSSLYS